MLLLFLVASGCFFAFFAALLLLLRRALRSGSLRAADRRRAFQGRRASISNNLAPSTAASNPLAGGRHDALSHHLLQKQPDWRFMVSDARQQAGKSPVPTGFSKPVNGANVHSSRSDWAYFNADLGDLRDPYQPEDTARARRA